VTGSGSIFLIDRIYRIYRIREERQSAVDSPFSPAGMSATQPARNLLASKPVTYAQASVSNPIPDAQCNNPDNPVNPVY
jgi:hypothetical protein